MQAWDQVQVVNPESEHNGRAGLVVGVAGDVVRVKLDESSEAPAIESEFAAADLRFLGR